MYKKINKKNSKLLMIILLIVISCMLTIYVINSKSEIISYIWDRYISQTISDPTGSGRTTQIIDVVNTFLTQNPVEFFRSLILGVDWGQAVFSEGIFNIVSYYGVLAAIVFCLLLLYPVKKLYKYDKIGTLGLIGVFIAFIVDSSFNYPPSLMNYFLMVGLLFQIQKKQIRNEVPK